MLSRAAYNVICKALKHLPAAEMTQFEAQAALDLRKPYVVVVHRESGHGYLLDRIYNLIAEIADIEVPDPKKCVEVELKHRSGCFQAPEWCRLLPQESFDSYWMY